MNTPPSLVSADTLAELYRRGGAAGWGVPEEVFAAAVVASIRHAFGDSPPARRELTRFLDTLNASDLALACACESGNPAAWDHFILHHRPALYRAANALDPTGSGRELADSLYAELYGLKRDDSGRKSLFRYYHGRSSLSTWLRAVLAQRFVDLTRTRRRVDPLADDVAPAQAPASADPDRVRLVPLALLALRKAIDALTARDRLRLRSYYVSGLTLAEIGRVTGEHEATVSRQLARTRRQLRQEAEQRLAQVDRLTAAQIARAFELALEDPGMLDVQQILGGDTAEPHARKESRQDRSL